MGWRPFLGTAAAKDKTKSSRRNDRADLGRSSAAPLHDLAWTRVLPTSRIAFSLTQYLVLLRYFARGSSTCAGGVWTIAGIRRALGSFGGIRFGGWRDGVRGR